MRPSESEAALRKGRIIVAIYFTSDLHLGHANAIKFANRPFDDVNEMNETLIKNVNRTVGRDDILYMLGDVSCGCGKDYVKRLLGEIRCKHVRLVVGNHDKNWSSESVFEEVVHYACESFNQRRLVLFHYPILEWDGMYHGSVHVHGHIHSQGPDYNLNNFARGRFAFDCGVDANGYKPVALDDILALADAATPCGPPERPSELRSRTA